MKEVLNDTSKMYDCWLDYRKSQSIDLYKEYVDLFKYIFVKSSNSVIYTAVNELKTAITKFFENMPIICSSAPKDSYIFVGTIEDLNNSDLYSNINRELLREGFCISIQYVENKEVLYIIGKDKNGVLYGVFHFIRGLYIGKSLPEIESIENPRNALRIINQWDNMNGEIERGYAGKSIFFKNNNIVSEFSRIKDYARLLASICINGISINNVNVHEYETKLITKEYLPQVAKVAEVFRNYGIKLYLSVNFAAPVELGELETADPVNTEVMEWWKEKAKEIYDYIPDFGGFLVKADSEFRPGPFTYGRNHAEGANMLAQALKPYNGIVIWRCFVYNCLLDWRDRSKDRAKAAYENFKPLDGKFLDNVVLQIKYGPMDFQIREAVSPLFGAMEETNEFMELQITQEYTGQQKHLCYLVPLWKECLDFDTYAKGKGSEVKKVVSGSLFNSKYGGIAGVSNIGDSLCWTGHPLAQANLYGFGRLTWNPDFSALDITKEWIKLTFACDEKCEEIIISMLLKSREIYEKYTSPLGIGWMVNPNHHYGPSVDGYEYSLWGTYHYADFKGLGVDRTAATGTAYTLQYKEPVAKMYESLESCSEELLLFFHHVPYTYKLSTGKTVIQHIYDTHFEGVEEAKVFRENWIRLKENINNDEIFNAVLEKLDIQIKDAKEWRDVVNTYFYRKTGIKDNKNRRIYE
ncbi:alpha-glucuronidase family glycosyl hydrolase [Clostridium sp. BL-8]|uniref:alpha-glucuronidase family glycosyl hydrolase n=1 Tax=Clostridium sp. BL-8 TaxID=349938 RepID=UPI00098BD615|nr:alpha-glucuronidase family glycosyl hydrolase [Clostridium sp. BL-8]OOM80054.1 xylan alpha-(1->2)-glucuronosidase [Clostridium sp. BL-8]